MKPKVAVFKFASCDGCQLSLLDCEDELLAVVGRIQVANFLEASREVVRGPYDVTLVEGSITTSHDAERIQHVRKQSRFLVTIGACATAGGIQALRNFTSAADYAQTVYPHPEYLDYLDKATPISDSVEVDLAIWGCPVNKQTVLEVITALLQNRKPNFPPSPVCIECKRNGTQCVLVAQGIPCLGPVVHGGCGALCPANGRGCYGCFGPSSAGNFSSIVSVLQPLERFPGEAALLLHNFSCYAPSFRKAAEDSLKVSATKETK